MSCACSASTPRSTARRSGRGSRLATAVALVGLLCLVVVQASTVLGTPAPESGDLARLALTTVLTGLLGLAARAR